MTDKPEWWPAGCKEHYVRECNCPYCADLIAALEEHREGIAIDGEHNTLDSFA